VLLNNAGSSIEATVNKAAPGHDASFAFKTGFSARMMIGLLGSDDFSFKVSPDGSAYHEAMLIDRNTGHVELPEPAVLSAASSAPAAPAADKLPLYARSRAGRPWLDAMRSNGRDFSLQPHLGQVRTATWLPSWGATIAIEGMSNATVGTVSTPGLSAGSLADSDDAALVRAEPLIGSGLAAARPAGQRGWEPRSASGGLGCDLFPQRSGETDHLTPPRPSLEHRGTPGKVARRRFSRPGR
jgi:hypothetical protein